MTFIVEYIHALLDLVYPRHCFSCDGTINKEDEVYICDRCREGIKIIDENRCARCGLPLGPYANISNAGCATCKNVKLWFDSVHSAARYEGVVRKLIHRYKYGRNEALTITLNKILIENVPKYYHTTSKVDIVVPVPLFWLKRIKRGFNQSQLLARGLAKHLSLPISMGNLRRIRNTASQTLLSRHERIKNIQDAFDIQKPKEFLHRNILLVDDVITTGTTASECARKLKENGAKKVYVLTLARAEFR